MEEWTAKIERNMGARSQAQHKHGALAERTSSFAGCAAQEWKGSLELMGLEASCLVCSVRAQGYIWPTHARRRGSGEVSDELRPAAHVQATVSSLFDFEFPRAGDGDPTRHRDATTAQHVTHKNGMPAQGILKTWTADLLAPIQRRNAGLAPFETFLECLEPGKELQQAHAPRGLWPSARPPRALASLPLFLASGRRSPRRLSPRPRSSTRGFPAETRARVAIEAHLSLVVKAVPEAGRRHRTDIIRRALAPPCGISWSVAGFLGPIWTRPVWGEAQETPQDG